MDQIVLRSIRASGRHGAAPGERDAIQPFEADVVIDLNLAPAAAADDLSVTIDYAAVAGTVTRIIEDESFNLIETIAECIAAEVLSAHPAAAVEVEVRKLSPKMDAQVAHAAVRIRRERQARL